MTKLTGRPRKAECDNAGKACLHCGKMFFLRDRAFQSLGRFQKRKYCSPTCANMALGAFATSKGIDAEAFWRRTVATVNGCLEWTGRKTAKGYGQVVVARRDVRAHRFAYALVNGPVPAGMMVLHSCDNPSCVNPDHLRVGTAKDNWRNAIERNRLAPGQLRITQRHKVA